LASGVGEEPPAARIAAGSTARDGFEALSEIHEAARALLPREVWDYLESGAGEELTLRENRLAFSRWRFRPRHMGGIGRPDTSTSFMGIELAMPVMTAPFGADRYFHPEGQCAVLRAAAGFGIASMAPEASSFPLERLAEAAPAAARVMQLHPSGGEETVLGFTRRAEAAGYELLCLTLDAPAAGWRERGKRNRFAFDLNAIGGNFDLALPPEEQDVFGQLLDRGEPVWSWEQLARVGAKLPLPWIAKGVMTREDALAALDAGAVGLVVSNHGGRQLDGVPATLDQLPEIVEAVGGRVPIGIDGGIRRGTDILKALLLGADVVLLGRLAVYGLAGGGEAGVRRVLELLHAELVTSMALLGVDRIEGLKRSLIQPGPAVQPPPAP
jgi:isopentenyl diphosphate isomerase/L-lactate dehydrogenase-like FMN-dependent dehydrogenase